VSAMQNRVSAISVPMKRWPYTSFEKEMKYLHDNNFHVITISDLSYDENDNYLYVKDVALEPKLPGENVTTTVVEPTENVTANITAPIEVPTINATANVTSPTTLESNQTLDIVKKALGIP